MQQTNLPFQQSSTFSTTLAWLQHDRVSTMSECDAATVKTAATAGFHGSGRCRAHSLCSHGDCQLVLQRVFLCPAQLSIVWRFYLFACMCGGVCLGGWAFTNAVRPMSGGVYTHVHVHVQTLLDHLRASWCRDWAAARMG